MSTQVPNLITSIPTPNENPASIVQSVLAIKQTVEASHDFSFAKSRAVKTPTNIAIDAAIRRVTNS